MQIHFTNNFGKFTRYDFGVTQVTATVADHEHLEALNQGFLWRHGQWRQCRSTRVVLSETHYNQLPDAEILTDYDYDQLMHINTQYLNYRNYVYNPADVHIYPGDTIWGYYHQGQLIAWSRIHNYTTCRETAYFAWDSQNMRLRMGARSLEHEIAWAKNLGDTHLYLGAGYESCSKYKSSLQGFEWWTGSEWSRDVDQYCWLCDQETSINDFKSYENLIYNAR